MGGFVDFGALKQSVSIEQVADMLGLELKKSGQGMRGCCPIDGGDNPRKFVITPSKGVFYCFDCQAGGDIIELVAKVRDIPHKEAALEIATHFGIGGREKAPEKPQEALQALSYLEHAHPAVQALGFSEEDAERLGIGYAGKGLMKGTVAIPIRTAEGKLVGYVGAVEELRLPPKFHLP